MIFHRSLALLALLGCACLAQGADRPLVVLVSGEEEYHSVETLPLFAKVLETNVPCRTVYLERKPNPDTIDGLEALEHADLLILFARRMTLPDEQLKKFQSYFDSGRPVIGLRTASHAFQTWLIFDHQVLGGSYSNHYGKDLTPTVTVVPAAKGHSILRGVPETFASAGSLYRNTPLQSQTTALLMGAIPGHTEPVAWTHDYHGARIFYTSLGHEKDFENTAFRSILLNAVQWALNKPPTATVQ